MSNSVIEKIPFIKNSVFLAVLLVLCGLLYIPAFVYGYFWVWIVPFTAIMVFFLRAMIDNAIARVSQKGDAAVQAKAMIPEFILMNVIMTALLSLPFLITLILNSLGVVKRHELGRIDQSFLEWWLGWFAKDYYIEKMIIRIGEDAQIQILVSNLCFMVIAILAFLTLCRTNLKKLFRILLHKESYKFLQRRLYAGDVSNFPAYINIFVILFIYFYAGSYIAHGALLYELFVFVLLINFIIVLFASHIVFAFVEGKIRWNNE